MKYTNTYFTAFLLNYFSEMFVSNVLKILPSKMNIHENVTSLNTYARRKYNLLILQKSTIISSKNTILSFEPYGIVLQLKKHVNLSNLHLKSLYRT